MNCIIHTKQHKNEDKDIIKWCLVNFGLPTKQFYICNGKKYEIVSSVGETSEDGFWSVGMNTNSHIHIWFLENHKKEMLLFKTTWNGECLM